jgi:hypothetical protein
MPKPTDRSVRTTITIPPDVKASMDAVKEPVNWSAVATEAFRAKLLELESRKAVGTMDEVIQRLRASKKRRNDELYQEGKQAGEAWAKETAEAEELENLAGFVDRQVEYNSWENYLRAAADGEAFRNSSSIGRAIYGVIRPIEDYDWHNSFNFWEETLGDGGPKIIEQPVSFALGFIDGAFAIWMAVRNKLDQK